LIDINNNKMLRLSSGKNRKEGETKWQKERRRQ